MNNKGYWQKPTILLLRILSSKLTVKIQERMLSCVFIFCKNHLRYVLAFLNELLESIYLQCCLLLIQIVLIFARSSLN